MMELGDCDEIIQSKANIFSLISELDENVTKAQKFRNLQADEGLDEIEIDRKEAEEKGVQVTGSKGNLTLEIIVSADK